MTTPIITDVNTTESWNDGDTGLVISGSNFISPPVFPLSVAGRYLQQADGTPFLIKGDAAWSIMNQISLADAKTYLDDRASRGFNAILCTVCEDYYCDNSPPEEDADGNDPFSPTNDFSSPNEAYWSHVDDVVAYAKSKGIALLACPAYMGFSTDGWAAEIASESQATLTAFGEFLGARYESYGNIVWLGGGDRDLSADEITDVDDIMSGIDTYYSSDAFGLHTRPDDDQRTDYGSSFSWLTMYGVYTYTAGEPYNLASAFYADTPAAPTLFEEGVYEGENSSTPLITRTHLWQAVLGGATAGYIFGNHSIWCFGAAAAAGYFDGGWTRTNWNGQLGSEGSRGAAQAGAILELVSWHLFGPDTTGTVITSSLGSGNSRIVCGIASDGSAALAYVPTATSPTVDMSEFSGPNVQADWVDPVDGSITADSTYSASGTQAITHPGNNSESASDWVLKLVSVS